MNNVQRKAKIQEMINKASSLELELIWIPKIMSKQTIEEKVHGVAKFKNDKGLNSIDAEFMTSIHSTIMNGNHLTFNMESTVKRILPKYWKQYLSQMNIT